IVMQTRATNATNQEFMPVADGNGNFTFVIRSSQKCLDVPSASTAINVQLQQFTCNTTPAQSFRVTRVN
ncbi:MAG: RICIN domain-containing protein, partial [Microbacteriaceae bacterium]